MLGALITFAVLFALIRVFERKRDDLDGFQIAMVAIVPVMAVVIVRVVLGLLYPQPVLLLALPPLVLIGLTFALLYKTLDIPAGRSVGYTIAVVIANELMALAFAVR